MSFSSTISTKTKSGFCTKASLWFTQCLFTERILLFAVMVLVTALFGQKPKVSISLYLPEAVRGVVQNWCLSAAELKWVYDGDISSHVFENTITSMSRLNHSPLCYGSPAHPVPLTSELISRTCRRSLLQPAKGAIMDGPRAKTAPIAYQLPISTFLVGWRRIPLPLSQVNETTWICRYYFVQCTNCINLAAHLWDLPAGKWAKDLEEYLFRVVLKVVLWWQRGQ